MKSKKQPITNRFLKQLLKQLLIYRGQSTDEDWLAWDRLYRLAESGAVEYEVLIESLRQKAGVGPDVDILPPPDDDDEKAES